MTPKNAAVVDRPKPKKTPKPPSEAQMRLFEGSNVEVNTAKIKAPKLRTIGRPWAKGDTVEVTVVMHVSEVRHHNTKKYNSLAREHTLVIDVIKWPDDVQADEDLQEQD
jgi:hypothetical protein